MCIGPSSGAIGPVARDGHAGGVTNRPLLPAFVVLWSSGYVVGAIAIDVADPLPLLAARFLLASLLAVPLALRHGRWRGAPLGRLAVVGVLLQVVQFGGVYGGFALGVPAALAALAMLGLAPLVTSAIAVGTGHERGDARLWTGLAIGVVGVAISLAPELGDARVGVGIGVTLVGMLGLAGGTVVQKHWAGGADVRVSAAVQSVTGAVLVTPAVAVFGGRFDVGPRLLLSLGWLAWGMGIVTLLLLVVPAVTAIASAPILGEALHPASLVGMIVALVGVAAVIRREAPAEPGTSGPTAEPARRPQAPFPPAAGARRTPA